MRYCRKQRKLIVPTSVDPNIALANLVIPHEMLLPNRLYTLDITRGLASIAVVFWHWQHFYFDGPLPPENFDSGVQPFYTFFKMFYDNGGLAVRYFFLLSGFVFFWLYHDRISSGEVSTREFAVLRFARLYPLHLATLLLVAVLQLIHQRLLGGYFVYSDNDFYHFVLNIFFASYWGIERAYSFNAPIWSVSIEVGLYVLFFAFATIHASRVFKLVIVLTGLVLLRLSVFRSNPIVEHWVDPASAFFIGGLTFELLTRYLHYRSRATDLLIFTSAIGAWGGVMLSPKIEYMLLTRNNICLLFLFPITITALVLAELRHPAFGKRLSWIGDITYSTYLLHFPLQLLFATTVGASGLDSKTFDSPIVFGLFFFVLLVSSLAVFNFFERPAQTFLRKQFLRSKRLPLSESTGPMQ